MFFFLILRDYYAIPLQELCISISVILHYFFLAAFFLMLAEGVEMLLYIVFVFHVRRKSETAALIFTAWCKCTAVISKTTSLLYSIKFLYATKISVGNLFTKLFDILDRFLIN